MYLKIKESMNIHLYAQARMESTRLPGKTMAFVMGKPLLGYFIERLRQVKKADKIVILTTTQPADDVIEDFCQNNGIDCYRGSEQDVLARYYQAAQQFHPDAIVRVTADCPLIDPDLIDQVIQQYEEAYPSYDYLSNCLERTFPRGMDVEVFSFNALKKAFIEAQLPEEREHVTPYLYRHPELFRLKNVFSSKPLAGYRWTVDTSEDLHLITLILKHLYPLHPQFRLNDILELLQHHPDWNQINQNIIQKPL